MTAAERFARFLTFVKPTETCWLWTGGFWNNGYGQFNLGRLLSGQQLTRAPHQIMWRLLHDGQQIPAGYDVMHLCHNKACLRPDHLELDTKAVNRAASVAVGHYRGPRARIAPGIVAEALNGPRGTATRLARQHGIKLRSLMAAVYRTKRRQRAAEKAA